MYPKDAEAGLRRALMGSGWKILDWGTETQMGLPTILYEEGRDGWKGGRKNLMQIIHVRQVRRSSASGNLSECYRHRECGLS